MGYTDHTLNDAVCPITGEARQPDGFAWTDHSRPGVFNSCERCNTKGPASISQALKDLEAKRKAES